MGVVAAPGTARTLPTKLAELDLIDHDERTMRHLYSRGAQWLIDADSQGLFARHTLNDADHGRSWDDPAQGEPGSVVERAEFGL